MDVNGKVVVVTGAAQGIGRALAERFVAHGAAHVVAADLDEGGARDTAARIGGLGLGCDVTDGAAVAAMVERVRREVGEIDIYASNAGILERDSDLADAASAGDAAWQRSWDVNVMGHVHAARALLPGWRARRGGCFLATVSAAGLLSQIGSGPYSATKHAALGFCEHLAITHRDDGIEVYALCPQGVDTAMVRGADPRTPALLDGVLSAEAVADAAIAGIGAGRFLILPHPQVADYIVAKAGAYDRWLGGMAKLRRLAMAPVPASASALDPKGA